MARRRRSAYDRKSFQKNRRTNASTLFCGQHLQTQLFRTNQGLDLVGDNLSNRARRVRKITRGQGILAMNNEEPNSRECAPQLLTVEDSDFGWGRGRLNGGHRRRE